MKMFSKFGLIFLTLIATSYADVTKKSADAPKKAHVPCGPCHPKKPHNAFFVSGELLTWRPDQTGMTYCVASNDLDITDGSPFAPKNKEVHQRSEWGTGFRLGAGFSFVRVPCDIAVYWTRFHNTSHGSNSDKFILGTQILGEVNNISIGGSGFGGGNAHSRWNMDLDVVELDGGYRLCFNERFLLRPYIGLVWGWIDQSQKIKYNDFFDLGTLVYFDARIRQKNDFFGFGPKFGINGHFSLPWGFGIMGNLSTTLFYGKAHNPVKMHIIGNPLDVAVDKITIKYQQHRLIPTVQGQIGLTWGIMCAKHFSIDLAAIYELQYFWGTWRNQNSAIQNIFISDTGYGNLMLHGGTWRLGITF